MVASRRSWTFGIVLTGLLAAAGCSSHEQAPAASGSTATAPAAHTNASPPAPAHPGAAPAAGQGAGTAAAGPEVQGEGFDLRAVASGPYRAGQLGKFDITLASRNGFHVNQDYPIQVDVTAPAGVTLPKATLQRTDAAEFNKQVAKFDVPFTPTAAGSHEVRAHVAFVVCTPQNCVPDERTLAVVLPVQ